MTDDMKDIVARATASVEKLVAEPPTDDELSALIDWLWTLNEAGELEQLISLSALTLDVLPEAHHEARAEVLNVHGQTLHEIGRLAEAQAAFEEMLKIGESNADWQSIGSAHLGLGAIEQTLGNATHARDRYSSAFRPLTKCNDFASLIRILLNLTQLAIDASDLDNAQGLLSSATELTKRIPDQSLRSTCSALGGTVAALRGDSEEALRLNRKALRQARRAHSAQLALRAMQNLAAVYLNFGKPRMARRWYEKGLAIAVAPPRRAPMLAGAAHAAGRAGDFEAALAYLQEHTAAAHATAARLAGAHVALEIGGLAFEAGHLDEAKRLAELAALVTRGEWDDYTRALVQLELRLEDARGDLNALEGKLAALLARVPDSDDGSAAFLLETVAHMMARRREHTRAAELLTDAVQRTKRRDASVGAWTSAQAGAVLLENGGGAEAVPFFADAARYYRRTNNKQLDFECSNDWANALAGSGEYGKALRLQKRCIGLGEALNDRAMIAQASLNLGETLRRKGDPRGALSALSRAGRLYRSLGDLSGEASVQNTRGLAWLDIGKRRHASAAFRRGLELAERAAEDGARAVALGGLASVAHGERRLAEARRLYEKALDLELADNDVAHAAESQAGLLRVLVDAREDAAAEEVAGQVLKLAAEARRMELAICALGESGSRALEDGREALALELFGASLVAALLSHPELETSLRTFGSTTVEILLSFAREDEERLAEWVDQLSIIVTRHLGRKLGGQLASLLKRGEAAARRALAERASS